MSGATVGSDDPGILVAAGLDEGAVSAWRETPAATHDYKGDCRRFSDYWLQSNRLIARLPEASRRSGSERAAAQTIVAAARAARVQFLRRHVDTLYDALTADRSRPVRVTELALAAAAAVPGLVPGEARIAAEDGRLQRDRSGIEIDQGLLVSAVMGSPAAGRHLCHAMLLPRAESLSLLQRLRRDGAVAVPGASVVRHGRASVVTYEHPRFLNAEDHGTLAGMETCVDLALLDEDTDIVVLRGGEVEHPKYRGRRIFGAGINLTHLYHGRIPFLWYLERDLGYVNKIYRGLTVAGDAPPDEWGGATREKLWIAAVEGFAIGGHCQVLLVCDHVLAETDAYLTLPARKEGIIPGAANLRLPRFTGDRIARQAILNERRIACASPEGRLICDAIVPPGGMAAAIEEQVSRLTNSGIVSAAGNRRAFRIGEEPLELFRSYMAVYAREQALCHFSPALIANLERHWNAQNRKP